MGRNWGMRGEDDADTQHQRTPREGSEEEKNEGRKGYQGRKQSPGGSRSSQASEWKNERGTMNSK